MKNNIQELTLTSVFIAIIILMATVPMLGFIQIGAVSYTIIHVPVILGITLLGTRRGGVILGLAFGFASFFVALTRPAGPVDVLFQNPLVSVVPRLLFGMAVYELFNIFKKFVPTLTLNVTITAVISTFLHAVFVLVPLYYFGLELFGGTSVIAFIGAVMASNSIVEMIIAGIVAPLVFLPVNKIRGE
jgi:uncharacterized membrane protein